MRAAVENYFPRLHDYYTVGPSTTLSPAVENWTFAVPVGTAPRWQYDMPASYGEYAHSGLHYLYADDFPGSTTDATATLTSVLIPANAYLHFAQAYAFEFSTAPARYYDGGVLEYSANGGGWTDAGRLMEVNGYDQTIYSTNSTNPLKGRQAFAAESHGYISTRVSLSTLAGQNVQFRWRMGLDQAAYSGVHNCRTSKYSSVSWSILVVRSNLAVNVSVCANVSIALS